MKMRTIIALALVGTLATGCVDTVDSTGTTFQGSVGTTTAGGTDTTAMGDTTGENLDPAAAMAMLQQDMTQLGEEIQNSEAAAELRVRWEELQVDMTTALTAMQDDGTLDVGVIQDQLQQFEDDLEALGNQVEPELRAAWDTFREDLDQLIS